MQLLKVENNRLAADTKLGRLEDMFTTEQRRLLYSGQKRIVWKCSETITSALTMRFAGPKLYNMLLGRKWPLPSIRTLKRITSRLVLKEGFLEPVLKWFENNPRKGKDRYCVVEFDEMSLMAKHELILAGWEVISPAERVQLVLVRGLFGDWKQTVYVAFNENMTGAILKSIVDRLEKVGLRPCASVADLGGSNRGTWTDLAITEKTPYFESSNKNKIYVFADPPHMIKLARNHLIDSGYKIGEDKGTASIAPVKRLIDIQRGSDLRLCPRLKTTHVPEKKKGNRMKVGPAVKLMSNSVSAALTLLTERNVDMPEDTLRTAYLLKMFNDW